MGEVGKKGVIEGLGEAGNWTPRVFARPSLPVGAQGTESCPWVILGPETGLRCVRLRGDCICRWSLITETIQSDDWLNWWSYGAERGIEGSPDL